MKLNATAVINNLTLDKPLYETLTDSEISEIQGKCQALYAIDLESCQGWRDESKRYMDMAKMESEKRKGHIQPWQSDIQVPDLLQAAIQFNARSYPEYVKDGKVCKPKICGKITDEKQERASRVIDHLNWQLTEQITEWPENLDKLLITLPIVGHMFKVSSFDDNIGRIVDTLCMPDQVVINNAPNNPNWSRRIAIDYPINSNQLVSNIASKKWRDIDITPEDQDSKTYSIVDMYMWYDLDGDDYEEPYIITFDKTNWQLLSIVPRYDVNSLKFEYDPKNPEDAAARDLVGIDAIEYVTSYQFIPSPDGSALGIGYGKVGGGMITGMNMFINQLADAGTLNNLSAGIVAKGVFRDDGAVLFNPGEWKIGDSTSLGNINEKMWKLPVNPPSPVTMQLYEEQKQTFGAIASTSEIVSGTDLPSGTPATSILAIIDQAKIGNRAILKRINIAMGREFKVLFRLNQNTLTDEVYFTIGDHEQKKVAREDYNMADYDVVPVADPQYSSRIERLTKSQVAMQLGVNSPALIYDTLIDIGYTSDQAKKYMESNQNEAAMAAQAQLQAATQAEKTAKAQKDLVDTQIRLMDAQTRARDSLSKDVLNKTQGIKNLADAEAVEAGTQIDVYALQLQALQASQQEVTANEQGEQGGLPAMGGQPGNEGGISAIGEGDEGAGQSLESPASAEFDVDGIGEIQAGDGSGSEQPLEPGQPEEGGV